MQSRLALKVIGVHHWLWVGLSVAVLAACVTINVYFPAAAAEAAADKIIDRVWESKDADKSPNKSNAEGKSNPQSSLRHSAAAERLLLAASNALDFLVSPAHAEANLNISTPSIRQLTQSMEARHAQLKKYYDSGAIGLTANGLIDIRDLNLVPLPERTQARKLMADENADRNNLYREIAVANGHPEWEADIRSTFAQRWIQRAASGWYYQDAGGWKQK